MATIQVDFSKIVGKMKPLHGVGQPPFRADVYECPDYSMFAYLKEAGFTHIRVYADRRFEDPRENEQRIYIKARKGKRK